MEKNKREYFYYSEIILGLRKKYQENERKISDIVGKYVTVTDPSVKEVYSTIRKNGFDFEFIMDIRKEQNIIKGLIDKLTAKKETVELYNIDDVQHDLMSWSDARAIKVSDVREFGREVDELLLLNKFNRSIEDTYRRVPEERMNFAIAHDGIFGYSIEEGNNLAKTGVDYSSRNDQLVIHNIMDSHSDKDAKKILNTRIPANLVNSYLQDIIVASPDISLPIELSGYTLSKDPQYFALEKEEDRILARRVR